MPVYLADGDVTLWHGDAREWLAGLPDGCAHAIVTSPPFWGLRDYGTGEWSGGDPACDHVAGQARHDTNRETPGGRGGSFRGGDVLYRHTCGKCGAVRTDGQIGLEDTPTRWAARLLAVFAEAHRVLRHDGTLWVEVGDTYNSGGGYSPDAPSNRERQAALADGATHDGAFRVPAERHGLARQRTVRHTDELKHKDLVGAPWLLAFALRARGWYLRADIVWHKLNPMPEAVRDRPTKAHSYVFLFSKRPSYYYDAEAIAERAVSGTDLGLLRQRAAADTRVAGGYHAVAERVAAGVDSRTANPRATRNIRSVWPIPTGASAAAHYATYPETLVERCILAGTSEHGACPACGAPYARLVERVTTNPGNRTTNGRRERTDAVRGFDARREVATATSGWQATCTCDAGEPVPCLVLDPFVGTGTTPAVARRLGRHAAGADLNATYLAYAAERLAQRTLFAPEPPPPAEPDAEQLSMEAP